MRSFAQVADALSPVVREWIANAVGPGAEIQSMSRLAGATSSTLYDVRVAHGGRQASLVLRLFTNREWLVEEPDLALHEATNLQHAARADVPTPELVAYDPDGERCGVPAVLMTRLPGAVELAPSDPKRWLWQMAEVLVPLHAIGVPRYPWRYTPYNDLSRLEPPAWSRVPELWARAIAIVQGPQPETHTCFIHRDYHPTNVLWHDGRLCGIVDWPNACLGPPGIDVAWCRHNLAGLCGVEVADQFLHACRTVAGATWAYDPFWDLMTLIEVFPGPPDVYEGWIAFGVHHLDSEIVRRRLDAYLASVLARF